MIDLIIPVYNNWYELLETLRSCGRFFNRNDLLITIVDDGSDNITDQQYQTLPSTFPHLRFNILRLKKNHGPGYARQYAVEHTSNPYIIFIDSGDLWISIFILPNYINFIKQNPHYYLCVPGYLYELPDKTMVVQHHHQFHGVMMAREFINKYNLKIPTKFSYMGDDTPYLPLCHLLANRENKLIDLLHTPYIFHTYNETSIVNHNKGDYFHKANCRSFLIGAMELIEQHPDIDLTDYIYLVTVYGYGMLLDCNIYNHEYYKAALPLYSYFYHTYAQTLINNNPDAFYQYYNEILPDLIDGREFNAYYVFDIKAFLKTLD